MQQCINSMVCQAHSTASLPTRASPSSAVFLVKDCSNMQHVLRTGYPYRLRSSICNAVLC
eukprot:scaffold70488_cov18-Tisochrysis_lutea.AAC.2